MTLTVGELFAGCGGFGIGFERAGFEVRWQVENNPDCVSVLARHWPNVKRYGDVSQVDPSELESVDVITFGSPCQDMSVAGKRAGLAGKRSGLFYEATRIIAGVRPGIAVWENVPGALSSRNGLDFLAVLDSLAESGALDICGRILDAQGVGDCPMHRDDTERWAVPQRRRRIFVVSDYRAHRAYQILFDGESVRGDSEASGEAGQRIASGADAGVVECGSDAATLRSHPRPGSNDVGAVVATTGDVAGDYAARYGKGTDSNADDTLIIAPTVAAGLTAGGHPNSNMPGRHKEDDVNLVATFHEAQITSATNRSRVEFGEPSDTLNGDPRLSVVQAFDWQAGDGGDDQSFRGKSRKYVARAGDYAGADRASGADAVSGAFGVRRLTPREAERLQGWPDDHTRYRADGSEISDSARYRMIGNGVAANCSEWLARRIAAVLHAEQPSGGS